MEVDASVWSFNVALGVLLVDILLSGDNAIVIALVTRTLDKKHRMKALWLGILGAFAARLFLTSIATFAMEIPLIKLIGGFLLLKISIGLIIDNSDQGPSALDDHLSSRGDIFSAVRTIVLADVVMSLDNVLALSAITQNNFQMLMAGLLLSIPILMFGSLYIARLLDVYPELLWVGGAILGGVSGGLMVDDPILGGAIVNPSSLASLVVPVLAAAYTVMQSKIILRNQQSLGDRTPPASLWKIIRPATASAEQPREKASPEAYVAAQGNLADALSTSTETVGLTQDLEQVSSVLPEPPGTKAVPLIKTVSDKQAAPAIERGMSQRIYIGLVFAISGAFFIGWIVHFFSRAPVMPEPEHWVKYQCKSPDLVISYYPGASEMRLTSAKGVVRTPVTAVDGRINWKNYQVAGFALGVTPPVKIVSAGATKLVVDGGAFENAECLAVGK
ncbi:TerC family protein [Rhodoferax sp.]|uniref:TerC family protein n=1 Tax=Rhodoferax sp. TaxID=50421 RepID=UPI002848B3BB|nr:TerC family protein [Rhodoferax sp.]MDR3368384.1 TerC family protein [Rhodoferax sp.]